jgi:hypothetical protein
MIRRRASNDRPRGATPLVPRGTGAGRQGGRAPAGRNRPVGARPAGRRRGGQARKPRPPFWKRLRPRLPTAARAFATLGIAASLAGMIAALNGPWLRVEQVAYAGVQFTPPQQLAEVLAPAQGVPLLALDATGIAARLRGLPAVADAHVEALLPNAVKVSVTEKTAAFIWQTHGRRLFGAADGTLIGDAPTGKLSGEIAALPFIEDRRESAAELGPGATLPAETVATALRLVALDPARLGSTSSRLSVQVDDEFGFILVSAKPAWRAAFGFYGLDPMLDIDAPEQQVERQVSAVRTLFAAHPESTVSWVDARNPGKVYFRAKG